MPVQQTNHYRYKITKFIILIPDKEDIQLNTFHIDNFSIEKDFDNNIFPIFHVILRISTPMYYTILQNKTTVKFRIRVDKYTYDNNDLLLNSELSFDDIFTIYITDNSEFFDKSLYEAKINVTGSTTDMHDIQLHEFYLFKEKDLDSSKTVFNTVIKNSNLETVVSYMLSESGSNNILMTPIENREKIDEIFLLPISVNKNISYLENQYGFYSHGLLFFYDIDRIYFIDKQSECTAYTTTEYKKTLITIHDSNNIGYMMPGTYKDKETSSYTMNVPRTNIVMNSTSIVDNQLSGNKITVVNNSIDVNTQVSPSLQQRGSSSQKVVVNKYNNPYVEKMIEYRKIENSNIVKISSTDVEMEVFTPNKKYMLYFEDSSINNTHGGSYRLTDAKFSFIKNGEYYVPSVIVTFKKS